MDFCFKDCKNCYQIQIFASVDFKNFIKICDHYDYYNHYCLIHYQKNYLRNKVINFNINYRYLRYLRYEILLLLQIHFKFFTLLPLLSNCYYFILTNLIFIAAIIFRTLNFLIFRFIFSVLYKFY